MAGLLASGAEGTCKPNGTFPRWMQGQMIVNFSDGSFAYANFSTDVGTVLFEPDKISAILTMAKPMERPMPDETFVWYEYLNTESQDPALRCSRLVPDKSGVGYQEYVHSDPALVPVCPKSIHDSGLEIEEIHPIKLG